MVLARKAVRTARYGPTPRWVAIGLVYVVGYALKKGCEPHLLARDDDDRTTDDEEVTPQTTGDRRGRGRESEKQDSEFQECIKISKSPPGRFRRIWLLNYQTDAFMF